MNVAELARGIVMAGIDGVAIDGMPQFGGYLLFGGEAIGVVEMRALADALRRRNGGLPPLIAIDQEGGPVMRLREGVEPMPAMMALGAAGDIELAARAGEAIAFDLRRAGCTLDFAPVLDLATEPENTVIGTRSLGSDPQLVAQLGLAVGTALLRGGMLPCYKHFPGHGSTAIDSHEALPVVDVAEDALRARDLVPFAQVAPGAPAMMSAHVVARAFDREKPATLSPAIADLLRRELGFRGALVTDCLEMNAVAERGSVESALQALAVGADLLVFSHSRELAEAAVAAISKAVEDGRISRERLREAHGRVNALRQAAAAPLPLDASPPHPGIGREIARRAVTLVRGLAHADPIASVAVSFGDPGAALEREAPALTLVAAPRDPSPAEIATLLAAVEEHDRRPLLLARRAHRYAGQAAAIGALLHRYPDAMVISLLEPFDVALFEPARHVLATCGDGPVSLAGLADVIFGGSMPTGRLPIL